MTGRYEYKVVELREGMIGGRMSGNKLEDVLNEHAREGWQLRGDHRDRGQGPDRARRASRACW